MSLRCGPRGIRTERAGIRSRHEGGSPYRDAGDRQVAALHEIRMCRYLHCDKARSDFGGTLCGSYLLFKQVAIQQLATIMIAFWLMATVRVRVTMHYLNLVY